MAEIGGKMEEDEGVSMVDVLKEEEMMEEDANAVLGGSDDKNCTYDMGYITRQALYVCITCTKDNSKKSAGICLACSLECHDGHELYELYTKRNFRCDCGNQRMSQECNLRPRKLENTDNKYNQNFQGLYCTCHRPYPDPEDEVEDDMIQCIVCEDWYHGRHLGTQVPADAMYEEMICPGCLKEHTFLTSYKAYAVVSPVTKVKSSETNKPVDIETNENEIKAGSDKSESGKDLATGGSAVSETEAQEAASSSEGKTAAPADTSTGTTVANKTEEAVPDATKQAENKPGEEPTAQQSEEPTETCSKTTSDSCSLAQLQQSQTDSSHEGALFFKQKWRKKLCVCDECKEIYSKEGVEYLLLEEDTVQAYEDKGKAKERGASQYDKGMAALTSMDRTQLVEVMHGYNDMKSSLADYLKKFADNKKVVRAEDIQEFFQTMQARKKQKTQATAVQHFCR